MKLVLVLSWEHLKSWWKTALFTYDFYDLMKTNPRFLLCTILCLYDNCKKKLFAKQSRTGQRFFLTDFLPTKGRSQMRAIFLSSSARFFSFPHRRLRIFINVNKRQPFWMFCARLCFVNARNTLAAGDDDTSAASTTISFTNTCRCTYLDRHDGRKISNSRR